MKTFYRFFLALALCLSQSVFATQSITNDAASAEVIFSRINAFRASEGLSPLQMNAAISAEAEKHSQDMAEHTIPFGHEGFGHRVSKLFKEFNRPRGAAENVAYMYKETNDVVPLWLHSSGHRRNIEGHFNLTGIGIAHDQHGRVYVTQIFLRADKPGVTA